MGRWGRALCRLLVGMQRLPQEELRIAGILSGNESNLDTSTTSKLKIKLAEEFREQLIISAPTNEDEAGLRRLAKQIREKKVIVKVFLKHSLHAKLYLLFRPDPINPSVGYLGSSNLTLSGLSHQGELNIDVLDQMPFINSRIGSRIAGMTVGALIFQMNSSRSSVRVGHGRKRSLLSIFISKSPIICPKKPGPD